MKRTVLSQAAETDLSQIFWQGLERFGARVTERYVGELEDVFALIARFPEAGRLREELEPPARVFPHGAHVILYEVGDDDILIVRIRSARENWMNLPESEEG